MYRLRLPTSLVLALTVLATTAISQDSYPHEMLDYLKRGMYVGMQRPEGTSTVDLSVYSDGQDGNLVVARSLSPEIQGGRDADEFAASHSAVREQLARVKESAPKELGIRIVGPRNSTIGRIIYIGTDYLLIELDDRSKRRLLPKSTIGRIDLDADPATFIMVRKNSKNKNGG